MKIKILFGLMFVLAAFTMNAQSFVSVDDAIDILSEQVADFGSGDLSVKDLVGNQSQAGTLTGTAGGNSQLPPEMMNALYGAAMMATAKEIEQADDTLQGIQNAESKAGLESGGDPLRDAALETVQSYIRDILSI